MIYAFVLLVCPLANHACTEKTPHVIVRREEGLGQYSCDAKLAHALERGAGKLKGRLRVRCESHEANRA